MTRPISSRSGAAARPVLLVVYLLLLLGVLSYLLPLSDLLAALWAPGTSPVVTDRDFANYWMAGQLAIQGEHLDLFSQPSYFPHLQQAFGADYQIRNWSYPPHFLLLLWPLGLLPYEAALVAFLGTTFALYVWAAVEFRRTFAADSDRGVLWLAVATYSVMMVVIAQNGFLTASLLLLGLAWMDRRPGLAGLCFAVLTIKPQLGLLLPLLLAFDRRWAVICWAAVLTMVLVAVSVLFFGLESWQAYLTDTLAYQRFVMTDWHGIFLRMMPTVFGGARSLGFPPEVAFALQWPVSVAAVVFVVWALWHETDSLRRAFVVVAGTFLVSPYAFNYDMGALVVVAAILLGSDRAPPGWPSQLAVGMVIGLAAVVMNLGRAGLPIAPILIAGALISVVAGKKSRRGLGSAEP